ncbi:MAG: restriction endonuclease subunit M [Alphaproteobacteria bacterium]
MVADIIFSDVIKRYEPDDLARLLGLHPNTVQRWIDKNQAPKQYLYDFYRILGNEKNLVNDSAKDKDQYYTKPEIADYCFRKLEKVARELQIDLSEYQFIEPSAGCGDFFSLLPKKRRIGIDIEPKNNIDLIKSDFLKWQPNEKKKYIVVGNPPFGLRGHLALQFINHSYHFADMVAFILPQLFASDGKGVAKKRVLGYSLAYTQKLPSRSFMYPNGKEVEVHTIFQIWTKIAIDKIKITKRKTCNNFVSIYSLSDGGTPASTRNKKMIGKCDIYLPSTCFSGMKAYLFFNELPNQRGYGVVIHKKKNEIKKNLLKNDWQMTSFKSTNSALNLRTSLIEDVIIKSGFYD